MLLVPDWAQLCRRLSSKSGKEILKLLRKIQLRLRVSSLVSVKLNWDFQGEKDWPLSR